MRSWMAGYPFRLIRSSRGMLNCQACPDFDHELSSFRDGPQDQTRNDCGYVSTNPVLDPVAAESLCPWGSAR